MKKNQSLTEWAKSVAKEKNITIEKQIYEGYYYSREHVRNIIYKVTFKGKSAVFKIYDDPRVSYEPFAHQNFLKNNRSKILSAPELYDYEVASPQKGWLLMEFLPNGGVFLKSPLTAAQRVEFLKVYLEYRKHYPAKPTRPLLLAEQLPSAEYHVFRIGCWLDLATKYEASAQLSHTFFPLTAKEFVPLYTKSIQFIRRVFRNRPMEWSHGHFKPIEIFKVNASHYYLTDFAHEKMYPQGYEFGFMVWSDWMTESDWTMAYKKWRKGIYDWVDAFEPVAHKLKINKFNMLARASLVERALGVLLTDVASSDGSFQEKKLRSQYLSRLIVELVL